MRSPCIKAFLVILLSSKIAYGLSCTEGNNASTDIGTIAANTAYAIPVGFTGKNWKINSVTVRTAGGVGNHFTAAVVQMTASPLATTSVLGSCNIAGVVAAGPQTCTFASPVYVNLNNSSTSTVGIQIKTDSAAFVYYSDSAWAEAVTGAEAYTTTMTSTPSTVRTLRPEMIINYEPVYLSVPTAAAPALTRTNVTSTHVGRAAGGTKNQVQATACHTAASNPDSLFFDTTAKALTRIGFRAPIVVDVIPRAGLTAGGGSVTILGSNFRSGATGYINNVACSATAFVSSSQLTCTTPAGAGIQKVSVRVDNSDGQTNTLASIFWYIGAPALWLRADNIAGLADGAAVGTWNDLSANGWNATQATAANKPTYKINIISGRPIVRFNGTSHFLDLAGATGIFQNKAAGSVFATVQLAAGFGAGQLVVFGASTATATNGRFKLEFDTTNFDFGGRRLDADTFTEIKGGVPVASTTYVLCDTVDWSAKTVNVYSNDVLQATSAAFLTAGNTSNTASAAVSIGALTAATQNFPGDIGEVIVYQSVPVTADRQTIQCYLADKYGVVIAGC